MSTGQFSLDIKWPNGKTCMDGQITDEQYGEICKILAPGWVKSPHINEMVNRFLSWKLPVSVKPDR